MKSRKDIERNKATVERYARKARMYYSNHPKIKTLLLEIDSEIRTTENRIKTAKREEAIGSFFSSLGGLFQTLLKNKTAWCIIIMAIGGILLVKGFGEYDNDYDSHSAFGLAFSGLVCIIGGANGLIKIGGFLDNDKD